MTEIKTTFKPPNLAPHMPACGDFVNFTDLLVKGVADAEVKKQIREAVIAGRKLGDITIRVKMPPAKLFGCNLLWE